MPSLHASRWHVNAASDENDEIEQHEESGDSESLALNPYMRLQVN